MEHGNGPSRSLSGYTFVCQTRSKAPEFTKGVLWFGPDVSTTTCFTPFFSKMAQLPKPYQVGSPQRFNPASAWWHFDLLANWTRLNFQRMTTVDIIPVQQELERKAMLGMKAMDMAVANQSAEEARQLVTEFSFRTASTVLNRWRNLSFDLFSKYSDGYINVPGQPVLAIGYPASWLKETAYNNGPTSYDMK